MDIKKTAVAALMASATGLACAQAPAANPAATSAAGASANPTATTPASATAAGGAPSAPAKPAMFKQTAVTPVEQIRLGDRMVPLNIRTLAEVKRLQDEKELRDKLQTALKSGTGAAPTTVPVAAPPAAPVAATPRTATSVTAANKPSRSRQVLVAVFGPTDNMQAELRTGPTRTIKLKAGDTLGLATVEAVTRSGLTLKMADGRQTTVAIGQEPPR